MTDVDQFSSGTAIDQESITKTPNGALQVSKPSVEVIGDFETDLGDWEKAGDTSFVTRSSSFSSRGTYSVEIGGSAESILRLNKSDYDVAGKTIVFDIYIETDGTITLQEDSGNHLWTAGTLGTGEWKTVEVDLSSLLDGYSSIGFTGTNSKYYIDNIRIKINPRETINKAVSGN